MIMANKSHLKKELYITPENIEEKTRLWLDDIHSYAKNLGKFPLIPSDSVLLITDMQHFFLDPQSHAYIPSARTIVPKIRNLLIAYRKAHLPVIFTRHALNEDEKPGIMGRWWKDVVMNEDPQSEIISELLPLENEIIIRKTRYSAFWGTELEDFLTIKMAKSLVICGVMTHLCCETTARDAFMRDFEVFFAVDGTASQTEELHLSSLRTLSNGFVIPITISAMINKIEEKEH
jgi:isochorismate hydrolase